MTRPQQDFFVFGLAIGLAVGLVLGAGMKALEYRGRAKSEVLCLEPKPYVNSLGDTVTFGFRCGPHRSETRLVGARIDLEKMVQTNWTEIER